MQFALNECDEEVENWDKRAMSGEEDQEGILNSGRPHPPLQFRQTACHVQARASL